MSEVSSSVEMEYFVCTLGQAARLKNGTPYRNVNHLLAVQAQRHPQLPAVGFYTPILHADVEWKSHVLTFGDLHRLSLVVAGLMTDNVQISKGQTVGLLAASSPEFLFIWLGLIALGCPVLLIAPQCSASAIAHLSQSCEATILLHDSAHAELARDAGKSLQEIASLQLQTISFPFEDSSGVLSLLDHESGAFQADLDISGSQVAYLHHSSGTSTGVPKPIPQSHHGAVGVLPETDGSPKATFTTTPLYHGGVADSFRAWSSAAMIWLFPGQHVPITAANVIRCFESAASAEHNSSAPPVKYFSSVPYVLQMLAEDERGLGYLTSMDIVGVGGAALPAEAGDSLVRRGVNLVSRYGSAECGFLMSSHRDYQNDKEWQYLRYDAAVKELSFERQDDGLHELVVLDGWPHMAKRNRDDGSFATADLLVRHSSIRDAWKYHSRADSQLTLITGKKFDPAPLEDSIGASSARISDVLIFGNGRPYPGALIFRSQSSADCSEIELLEELAPIVERFNRESQSHARLPRNMLIPMPFDPTPLEKSSKGTVLRNKAEEKFAKYIEDAYSSIGLEGNKSIPDVDVELAIKKIVESVVGADHISGKTLSSDTDLFAYGVDSVASVQIRHALTQLLPDPNFSLPLSVVEDAGNITRLSDLILKMRHGETVGKQEDPRASFTQLVDQYSDRVYDLDDGDKVTDRCDNHSTKATDRLYNVLLTGPTGSIGSHMLSQLLTNPRVNRIYLLVRGATPHAARERVVKALNQRLLSSFDKLDSKVAIMNCKLSEERMGLSKQDYQTLVTKVDIILHMAWSVNFVLSLRSIASTHLAGLQNLLRLAVKSARYRKQNFAPQFLFCSSVASVSNLGKTSSDRTVSEKATEDVNASGTTGYALSKLAAEMICSRYAQNTDLRGRITILRVGQVAGDTQHGIWSKTEAYPLMLGSSNVTNVLPELPDSERLNWLPVDVAATAFLEAAGLSPGPLVSINNDAENDSETKAGINKDSSSGIQPAGKEDIRVLHLLNPSTETTFGDFLQSIVRSNTTTSSSTHDDDNNHNAKLKIVSPTDWLVKLDTLAQNPQAKNHPSLKLLSFWKHTYGSSSSPPSQADTNGDGSGNRNDGPYAQPPAQQKQDERATTVRYEMTNSLQAMPSLRAYIGPLQEEYMVKLWRWIKDNM